MGLKFLAGYHECYLMSSVRKCLHHLESLGSLLVVLSFLLCNIPSTQRTCKIAASVCKLWYPGKVLTCRGPHPNRGAFMFQKAALLRGLLAPHCPSASDPNVWCSCAALNALDEMSVKVKINIIFNQVLPAK